METSMEIPFSYIENYIDTPIPYMATSVIA